MLALHLSRFLNGSSPPSFLQRANALAHQEPFDSIFYGLYWSFVLIFLAPMVGMVVLVMNILGSIFHVHTKDQTVDPTKTNQMEYGIVITGCDTGIGKELAVCLATEGFTVFAGCLHEESLSTFSGIDLIHPLVVDVTSEKEVQACADAVQEWIGERNESKRVLHSLVNNAGVGIPGYCDWLDVKDYEICMNVNYFGVIRMTKAFLPLLKHQAITDAHPFSQIVNIVSVAGMTSAGGLAASAYEGSKHACEAFTNALRLEMKMFGIRVVALNPSFFDTPMTTNVKQRFLAHVTAKSMSQTRKDYGDEFFHHYADHCEKMVSAGKWNLNVLVDTVVRIIKSKDPPAQLMVGLDRYAHATFNMLPQWARHFIIQLGIPPQAPAMMKKKIHTKFR